MTEEFQQEHSEDTMFQDAVAALREGNKPRARELLTLLLNADQNNPTYWIWLSAAVDNTKERVYCLQTALKLDPENGTAKRGLILLGALTPDETVQPFVMNRPRAWEEKLLLSHEKPKEKGLKAIMHSPIMRLVGILVIVMGLIAVVVFGFILPRQTHIVPTRTNTPGPSPTYTATPTVFGAVGEPTKIGPTPLWRMLPQTYTPTAVYVNTPRTSQSKDQYRSAQAAYAKGDWDAYIAGMKLIIPFEPDAADIPYLIGDAYRFKGDSKNAIKAYNDALKIDPDFGPPYLGLALVRLMDDPGVDVEFLFDEAIKRDPNFGEVYIERARFFLFHNNPKAAILDLDRANKLMPNSPEVYMVYAKAYIDLDDNENALEAAEKAYSLDITALPVYQLLGELYIESGQYQRAIEALNVSVTYEPEDDQAFAMLGRAYYEMKDYESALENLNRAMNLNRTGLRRFYVYRGLANLELNNIDQAAEDLEKAAEVEQKSFNLQFGLARAYFAQEKFGTAFQKIEAAKSLAETDDQLALAIYWHALIQVKRGQREEAGKDWQTLLAMDSDEITPEMRKELEERLKSMIIPTSTPKGAIKTPTPKGGAKTPTPKGRTPTPKLKGGTLTATSKAGMPTPTPTRTPTPTKKP